MNILKKVAVLAVVAGGLVLASGTGSAEAGHKGGFKFHKVHHNFHHNKFHHQKFHHPKFHVQKFHHFPKYQFGGYHHQPILVEYYWCDIHQCHYWIDVYGAKHYLTY